MISLTGMLLIGLTVGLLTRAFAPGNDKLGWVMTGLLGITGSFLASYVGIAMGWYEPDAAAGWVASALGALALLMLFGAARGE